jgi:hypothetical protein
MKECEQHPLQCNTTCWLTNLANRSGSTDIDSPIEREFEADAHKDAKWGIEEFAEFIGRGFWFNEDSDLWESFKEGAQFEVNGQMQFRFTTKELYQVYLTTKNINHVN